MVLDTESMRAMLQSVRTIAVVGAKDDPGEAVDGVGRYLLKAGYTLFPVHPKRETVWDLPAYKTLGDIPEPVDMVDLFRAAEYCPDHARETLALHPRPRVFWMQLGIRSPEATAVLEKEGITVVQDLCVKVEHRRVFRAR